MRHLAYQHKAQSDAVTPPITQHDNNEQCLHIFEENTLLTAESHWYTNIIYSRQVDKKITLIFFNCCTLSRGWEGNILDGVTQAWLNFSVASQITCHYSLIYQGLLHTAFYWFISVECQRHKSRNITKLHQINQQ